MSRYAAMFERLNGEGAFGAFLMLGDPELETSAEMLDAVPAQAAVLSGTHWQVVGDPAHVSLVAHAVHFAASAQPLLASVGTHLSPHFLVPAPQVHSPKDVPTQRLDLTNGTLHMHRVPSHYGVGEQRQR